MIEDAKLSKSQLLDELQRSRAVNSMLEETQKLFLNRPVVVFRWSNTEGWPVEYVSPNVSDIFGYSVDEFCTRKVLYAELIADSDLVRLSSEVETAVREGVQEFDHLPYRIFRQDGTECWLQHHTVVVRNDNNEVINFHGYVFEAVQQKQAENELAGTDLLAQAILDKTNTLAYVKDLDGYYLHINRRCEELFQIQRDNIIGKSDQDLFPGQKIDALRANDIQVQELDRLIEFEEQVPQDDGIHTYISPKFPIHDKSGKVYAVGSISTDITKQKCIEQELLESCMLYEQNEKLSRIGHFHHDLQRNEVHWSSEVFNILEVDPEQSVPSDEAFLNIVHPEDQDIVCHTYMESIANRIPCDFTHRLLMRDGSTKYVRERGNAVYNDAGEAIKFFGSIQDITLYKKAEVSLLDHTPVPYQSLDENGFFIHVNQTWQDTFGYLAEEVIGRSFDEFLSSNYAEKFKRKFREFEDCDENFEMEFEMVKKDGSSRFISAVGRVEYDSRGRCNRIYSILYEQKVEMLREVHHRIKNHLQGIIGLLKQCKKNSYECTDSIDEVISQIGSIASVYGIQARHSGAQIHFNSMLDAIIHSTAGLSRISLSVTRGLETVECKIDQQKAVALSLVINELMMNAVKHFRSKDEVDEIRIRHKYEADSILLTICNPGSLPDGFDFQAGKGLGTGLELAKGMLPSKGALLSITDQDNEVMVNLELRPPLLINVNKNRTERGGLPLLRPI